MAEDGIKQVICVRRDLKMRQGKAVSQGAHAAVMFMVDATSKGMEMQPKEQLWFSEGMPKICVRVDSEEELKSIIAKCFDAGLKCFPVMDAGHTEFHNVPTLTCCAIGPAYSSEIDLITGALKLL